MSALEVAVIAFCVAYTAASLPAIIILMWRYRR